MKTEIDNNFSFDLPKNKSNVMKVMGVGGGGSNAVNYMHSIGITNVEFIVCNTDIQALHSSTVKNQLQIGIELHNKQHIQIRVCLQTSPHIL